MTARRRQQFVAAHTAWMLGSLLLFVVLDAFAYDLFFVCSVVGLLVMTELTAPIDVTPQWRRRLRWVFVVAFIAFVGLVIRELAAELPTGVFW